MADSATTLGNIISAKVSGSIKSFGAGMKSSFMSASPALPAIASALASQQKAQAASDQRTAAFAEENAAEARKSVENMMALFKSMASNLESIAKDVRAILEKMKEPGLFDKLAGIIPALLAMLGKLPGKLIAALTKIPFGKIGDFFKGIPDFFRGVFGKIGDFFKGIPDFFKGVFGKIGDFFKGIPDFFKGMFGKFKTGLGGFIDNIADFFKKFKFPRTAEIISDFIDRLKKVFKFDEMAKLLKLDELVLKAKKFVGAFAIVLELAKFQFDELKRISGAKFDNLKTSLISNIDGIKTSIADSISEVGKKISSVFDGIKAFTTGIYDDIAKSLGELKASPLAKSLASLGDDVADSFRTLKGGIGKTLTAIAEDFSDIRRSFSALRTAAPAAAAVGAAADTARVGGAASRFAGMLPDVSDLKTFFTLGKESLNMSDLKYVLGEGGVVQQGATLIGKFVGDIGRLFDDTIKLLKPVGEFFKGESFLGKLAGFDDVMRLIGRLGAIAGKGLKFVPILGEIIMVVEGLFAAFDTEQISKDLNKQVGDVNWKDRLSALFGGIIGSLAGLGDLILMAVNAVFDTKFKTEGPESIQSIVTSYFTKFFSDIMSVIGSVFTLLKGIITFDSGTISRAFGDLGNTFDNMMVDFRDTFLSWVKTPLAKLNNAVMGWIDGIVNGSIDYLVDMLTGPLVEKIPGVSAFRDYIAGLKTNLSETNRSDDSPYVSGMGKDQTSAETARLARQSKPPTPSTGKNLTDKYNFSPASAGGRGTAWDARDLRSTAGLNIKEGDVQQPGASISPGIIRLAQDVQRNVNGVTFTGFNDRYHNEKASNSLHTKGLAFDFVVPANMAANDEYRAGIARAIASTGARVIDEYAYPSAKSTGGHFHVDFGGQGGIDLGNGRFGGEPGNANMPPVPPVSADTIEREVGSLASRYPAAPSVDYSGLDNDIQIPNVAPASVGPVNASLVNNSNQQTTLLQRQLDQSAQRYKVEDEYERRRRALQAEFDNNMRGIFKPIVQSLMGPAGTTGKGLNTLAGTNLSQSLSGDFSKLGTKIFGKAYGPQMGSVFTRLSGVYLDQFITQTIAPMLGMSGQMLNRSINTYLEGKKRFDPAIAQTQAEIAKAKQSLTEAETLNKISMSDIIRAAAPGKGFSQEQKSKIIALNAARKVVSDKEEALSKLKAQKKQYTNAAIEDLFYGMTKIPTGPRSMIEAYGGEEALTRDLAEFAGQPFKPAFGLDSAENTKLQAQTTVNNQFLTGQAKINDTTLKQYSDVFNAGAQQMGSSITSAVTNMPTERYVGGRIVPTVPFAPTSDLTSLSSIYEGNPSLVAADIDAGFLRTVSPELQRMYEQNEELMRADIDNGSLIVSSVDGLNKTMATLAEPVAGGGSGSNLRSMAPGAVKDRLMGFGKNMIGSTLGTALASRIGVKDPLLSSMFSRFGSDIMSGKNPMEGITQGFSAAGSGGLGNIVSGISGIKNADFSSVGGVLNTAMSAYRLYNAVQPAALAGSITSLGTGIQTVGNFLGSQTIAGFGGGMAASGSGISGAALGELGINTAIVPGLEAGMTAGSTIAAVALPLAVAVASHYIGKAISNGYSVWGKSGNRAVNVLGIFGGLLNRTFGYRPKEIESSGYVGTLGSAGQNQLQEYTDYKQKGGWAVDDKFSSDPLKTLDSETAKAFNDITRTLTTSTKNLGRMFDFNLSKFNEIYTEQVKIDISKAKDDNERQKILAEAFQKFGAGLTSFAYGVTGIDAFKRPEEDALQALTRLSTGRGNIQTLQAMSSAYSFLPSAADVTSIVNRVSGAGTFTPEQIQAAYQNYIGGGLGNLSKTIAGSTEIRGTGRYETRAVANEESGAWYGNFGENGQGWMKSFEIMEEIVTPLRDISLNLKDATKLFTAELGNLLAEEFGGQDQFSKTMGSFIDRFYTAEEKMIMQRDAANRALASTTDELADVGLVMPQFGANIRDSANNYRQMVDNWVANTAGGLIDTDEERRTYKLLIESGNLFMDAAELNLRAATASSNSSNTLSGFLPDIGEFGVTGEGFTPINPTIGINPVSPGIPVGGATREEVLAAYANTPGANQAPTEDAILYWMRVGLRSFAGTVAAMTAVTPVTPVVNAMPTIATPTYAATREEVLNAYRTTPGANPNPTEDAILYWMGAGLGSFAGTVASMTNVTPSNVTASSNLLQQQTGNAAAGAIVAAPITSIIDNSVNTVSSPQTNVITRSDDVRDSNPVYDSMRRYVSTSRVYLN